LGLRLKCALALLLLAINGAAAGASCTVSATSLAFGSYLAGTGPLKSSGTATVSCTAGTFFALGASGGNLGTQLQRLLANGSYTVQYNLYLTSAYATIWGDGTQGTGIFDTTATSTPSVFPFYGLLPDNAFNQGAAAGSYTDNIVVVVSF
jgi:spore coat protein U-like protein